jgi:hypothetical protein
MKAINRLHLLAAAALSSAEPSPGCSQPQTSGSWTNEIPFDGSSYTHAYTYPDSASEDNPAPLIMFFHGWGGSSSDCGNSCATAAKRGYATIAMTGIGEAYGELNSWNGFGSTASNTGVALPEALIAGDEYCGDEKENDRICDLDAYELGCYAVRFYFSRILCLDSILITVLMFRIANHAQTNAGGLHAKTVCNKL